MKKFFGIALSTMFAMNVHAQSVDEGIKMYYYEKYQSSKNILQPLAASDDVANYYLGLATLSLEDTLGAKQIFANKPNSYHNQAGLARISFLQKNAADAKKTLNAIVDKARKREWEKFKIAADAITYTTGGDIQDAISWYQRALDREQRADIYIGLGDAYLKLQTGGGEAMNNYEAALQEGSQNSLAYSRIGRLWYIAQNYEAALTSYNQAKEADPNNPLPYRELAQAYERAGRYENALTNIEEYLSKSDQSITDQITYANILFLADKFDEAQAKMEELIAKGAERPYMYRIIAYTAFENGNYQKALENMHRFYAKEPNRENWINNDFIYSGKIMVALAGEDSLQAPKYNDSAAYYFNQISFKDSTIVKDDIYREIGEVYKDARNYSAAGEWYGKIIEENENAAALDYFYWGYWNFYGENYEEAEKALTEMKAKYPNEGSAYFWLGRIHAAQDAEAISGAAVPYYKEWLAFENENYEHRNQELMQAYQYLAFYYYNQEDEAQAMEWTNKILEIDPENSFAVSIRDYYASSE